MNPQNNIFKHSLRLMDSINQKRIKKNIRILWPDYEILDLINRFQLLNQTQSQLNLENLFIYSSFQEKYTLLRTNVQEYSNIHQVYDENFTHIAIWLINDKQKKQKQNINSSNNFQEQQNSQLSSNQRRSSSSQKTPQFTPIKIKVQQIYVILTKRSIAIDQIVKTAHKISISIVPLSERKFLWGGSLNYQEFQLSKSQKKSQGLFKNAQQSFGFTFNTYKPAKVSNSIRKSNGMIDKRQLRFSNYYSNKKQPQNPTLQPKQNEPPSKPLQSSNSLKFLPQHIRQHHKFLYIQIDLINNPYISLQQRQYNFIQINIYGRHKKPIYGKKYEQENQQSSQSEIDQFQQNKSIVKMKKIKRFLKEQIFSLYSMPFLVFNSYLDSQLNYSQSQDLRQINYRGSCRMFSAMKKLELNLGAKQPSLQNNQQAKDKSKNISQQKYKTQKQKYNHSVVVNEVQSSKNMFRVIDYQNQIYEKQEFQRKKKNNSKKLNDNDIQVVQIISKQANNPQSKINASNQHDNNSKTQGKINSLNQILQIFVTDACRKLKVRQQTNFRQNKLDQLVFIPVFNPHGFEPLRIAIKRSLLEIINPQIMKQTTKVQIQLDKMHQSYSSNILIDKHQYNNHEAQTLNQNQQLQILPNNNNSNKTNTENYHNNRRKTIYIGNNRTQNNRTNFRNKKQFRKDLNQPLELQDNGNQNRLNKRQINVEVNVFLTKHVYKNIAVQLLVRMLQVLEQETVNHPQSQPSISQQLLLTQHKNKDLTVGKKQQKIADNITQQIMQLVCDNITSIQELQYIMKLLDDLAPDYSHKNNINLQQEINHNSNNNKNDSIQYHKNNNRNDNNNSNSNNNNKYNNNSSSNVRSIILLSLISRIEKVCTQKFILIEKIKALVVQLSAFKWHNANNKHQTGQLLNKQQVQLSEEVISNIKNYHKQYSINNDDAQFHVHVWFYLLINEIQSSSQLQQLQKTGKSSLSTASLIQSIISQVKPIIANQNTTNSNIQNNFDRGSVNNSQINSNQNKNHFDYKDSNCQNNSPNFQYLNLVFERLFSSFFLLNCKQIFTSHSSHISDLFKLVQQRINKVGKYEQEQKDNAIFDYCQNDQLDKRQFDDNVDSKILNGQKINNVEKCFFNIKNTLQIIKKSIQFSISQLPQIPIPIFLSSPLQQFQQSEQQQLQQRNNNNLSPFPSHQQVDHQKQNPTLTSDEVFSNKNKTPTSKYQKNNINNVSNSNKTVKKLQKFIKKYFIGQYGNEFQVQQSSNQADDSNNSYMVLMTDLLEMEIKVIRLIKEVGKRINRQSQNQGNGVRNVIDLIKHQYGKQGQNSARDKYDYRQHSQNSPFLSQFCLMNGALHNVDRKIKTFSNRRENINKHQVKNLNSSQINLYQPSSISNNTHLIYKSFSLIHKFSHNYTSPQPYQNSNQKRTFSQYRRSINKSIVIPITLQNSQLRTNQQRQISSLNHHAKTILNQNNLCANMIITDDKVLSKNKSEYKSKSTFNKTNNGESKCSYKESSIDQMINVKLIFSYDKNKDSNKEHSRNIFNTQHQINKHTQNYSIDFLKDVFKIPSVIDNISNKQNNTNQNINVNTPSNALSNHSCRQSHFSCYQVSIQVELLLNSNLKKSFQDCQTLAQSQQDKLRIIYKANDIIVLQNFNHSQLLNNKITNLKICQIIQGNVKITKIDLEQQLANKLTISKQQIYKVNVKFSSRALHVLQNSLTFMNVRFNKYLKHHIAHSMNNNSQNLNGVQRQSNNRNERKTIGRRFTEHFNRRRSVIQIEKNIFFNKQSQKKYELQNQNQQLQKQQYKNKQKISTLFELPEKLLFSLLKADRSYIQQQEKLLQFVDKFYQINQPQFDDFILYLAIRPSFLRLSTVLKHYAVNKLKYQESAILKGLIKSKLSSFKGTQEKDSYSEWFIKKSRLSTVRPLKNVKDSKEEQQLLKVYMKQMLRQKSKSKIQQNQRQQNSIFSKVLSPNKTILQGKKQQSLQEKQILI